MSATRNGTQTLPTEAPTWNKTYAQGSGEVEVQEWGGERSDILAKYEELKAEASAGSNIASVEASGSNGRSKLVARFGRTGSESVQYGDDVTIIEELYAVDVIKDLRSAPYFSTAEETKLTDDEVSWVQMTVDNQWSEAEITAQAAELSRPGWAAWTAPMKELKYHLMHGMDSYFETGFILRQSLYGVRTSSIRATFVGINTVVTAPTFESAMDDLILGLPDGEWLYKPPGAEHLGRGKWRISKEWHWAEKWSKVYENGTWGL